MNMRYPIASLFSYTRGTPTVNMKKKASKCTLCGQEGHTADKCTGKARELDGSVKSSIASHEKPFELLRIFVLREYLAKVEFGETHFNEFESFPIEYDFERIVDDFVFLCMFVGNDFLPHLPSLEIREGALEVCNY